MNATALLDEDNPFPSLEELGFEGADLELLKSKMEVPVGLVLVAGISGSRLDMTINACALHAIDLYAKCVEVIDSEGLPAPTQGAPGPGEVSPCTKDILLALRRDPDLLLVSEPRSDAAFNHLIRHTESGHKVLSTTHAASSLDVLRRLMKCGISAEVLKSRNLLSALVYQVSLPVLCPQCSLDFDDQVRLDPSQQFSWENVQRYELLMDEDLLAQLRFTNPAGCECCEGGVIDRTLAVEVACPDEHMIDLMARGEELKALDYFREQGGRTALDNALAKAFRGLVDLRNVEHKLDLITHYITRCDDGVRSMYEEEPIYALSGATAIPVVREPSRSNKLKKNTQEEE